MSISEGVQLVRFPGIDIDTMADQLPALVAAGGQVAHVFVLGPDTGLDMWGENSTAMFLKWLGAQNSQTDVRPDREVRLAINGVTVSVQCFTETDKVLAKWREQVDAVIFIIDGDDKERSMQELTALLSNDSFADKPLLVTTNQQGISASCTSDEDLRRRMNLNSIQIANRRNESPSRSAGL